MRAWRSEITGILGEHRKQLQGVVFTYMSSFKSEKNVHFLIIAEILQRAWVVPGGGCTEPTVRSKGLIHLIHHVPITLFPRPESYMKDAMKEVRESEQRVKTC